MLSMIHVPVMQGVNTMTSQSNVLILVGQLGCSPLNPVMPCQKEWLSFLNRTSQIRQTPEFKELIRRSREKEITRIEFRNGWVALLQTVSDI